MIIVYFLATLIGVSMALSSTDIAYTILGAGLGISGILGFYEIFSGKKITLPNKNNTTIILPDYLLDELDADRKHRKLTWPDYIMMIKKESDWWWEWQK